MNLNANFLEIVKKARWWLLANLIAIAVYLSLESWVMAPRREEEAWNGIDQIIFWGKFNLPVLIACFIVNVAWVVRTNKIEPPFRKWQFSSLGIVCLAWCIALIYHGLAIKILEIIVAMIDGKAWKS